MNSRQDEAAYRAVKDLQRLKAENLGEIRDNIPPELIDIYKVIAYKHPTKGWTH